MNAKVLTKKKPCNKELLKRLLAILNVQVTDDIVEDLDCEELLTFANNWKQANRQNMNDENFDFWHWYNEKVAENDLELFAPAIYRTVEIAVKTSLKHYLAKTIACETNPTKKLNQVLNWLDKVAIDNFNLAIEALQEEFGLSGQIVDYLTQRFVTNFDSIFFASLTQFVETGGVPMQFILDNVGRWNVTKVDIEARRLIEARYTRSAKKAEIARRFKEFVIKLAKRQIREFNLLHRMTKLYTWTTLQFIVANLVYDKKARQGRLQFTSRQVYDYLVARLGDQIELPSIHSFRNMLTKYVIPALERVGFRFETQKGIGYICTIEKQDLVEVLLALLKTLNLELDSSILALVDEIDLQVQKKLATKDNLVEALLLGNQYKPRSKNRSELSDIAYTCSEFQWKVLVQFKLAPVSKEPKLVERLTSFSRKYLAKRNLAKKRR